MDLANPPPADLGSGPTGNLVEVLVRHRLLEGSQVDELPAIQVQCATPRDLARELIRRGWLTPYQVNQLFMGKGGQLVLGSYVLLERLGEGGMGQVFKARHQNLGRIAALKVIRKDRLSNSQALVRFQREIQAVAQLSHPNVVIAFDAESAGDTHYFAMEYVEGHDLGKLVKARGALPVDQACDCIRQAACGLAHAHERNLIHRDIKPSNLLLTAKGDVVKVLDLGLARLLRPTEDGDTSSSLTSEGSLMGTPDFIAPEQARDAHRADVRSDLYSLGCTFFYLVTGEVPFQGSTSTEKLYKHWCEPLRPVESLRPEVSPAVSAIIHRLMAKKPEDRFQSAHDLAAALALPIGGNGMAIPAAMPVSATAVQAPMAMPAAPPLHIPVAMPVGPGSRDTVKIAADATWPTRGKQKVPRGVVVAAVGGAVLVCGVILATTMLFRSGRGGASTGPGVGVGPRSTQALSETDAALEDLSLRFGNPRSDETQLRGDLMAFRRQYPGTPQSVKAAEMLKKLFSPLDGLQRRDIPQAELVGLPQIPVMAVFGERRRRHWGPAHYVAVSGDGRRIASLGPSDGLRVWDTRNSKELMHQQGTGGLGVAFVPDGKTVLQGRTDGGINAWDIAAGSRRTHNGPTNSATSMAFSTDGDWAATGEDDGGLAIWRIGGTKAQTVRPDGHRVRVHALAFSTDGKRLASGASDGRVRLWEVSSGKELADLDAHKGPVRCLAFTPDGETLASGGEDRNIKLWEVKLGRSKATLRGEADVAISSLTFVQDGKALASGSRDGTVQVWNLTTETASDLGDGHWGQVGGLAWSVTDSVLVSAGNDGTVRLWDPVSEEEQDPLNGPIGNLYAAIFTPDGTLAASGGDHTIRLWDPVRPLGQPRTIPGAHEGVIYALAMAGNGKRLISGSSDSTVKMWPEPFLRKDGIFLGGHQRGQVVAVSASPDGKTVASGSWYTEPGRTGQDSVQSGELKIYDGTTAKERKVLRPFRHGVSTVAVSPDGFTVFAGSWDGWVRQFEHLSGNQRWQQDLGVPVECVAVHPSGGAIVVGDRKGGLRAYDTVTQQSLKPLEGHRARVTGLAFSPDGQRLVSTDSDGSVALWPWPYNGKYLEAYKLPGLVNNVAFAPDSRHVVTANANGTAYIIRFIPHRPR